MPGSPESRCREEIETPGEPEKPAVVAPRGEPPCAPPCPIGDHVTRGVCERPVELDDVLADESPPSPLPTTVVRSGVPVPSEGGVAPEKYFAATSGPT